MLLTYMITCLRLNKSMRREQGDQVRFCLLLWFEVKYLMAYGRL